MPKFKDIIIHFEKKGKEVARVETKTVYKKFLMVFDFKFEAGYTIYSTDKSTYFGLERRFNIFRSKKKLEKRVQEMIGIVVSHFLNSGEMNEIEIKKEEKKGEIKFTSHSWFYNRDLARKIEMPLIQE